MGEVAVFRRGTAPFASTPVSVAVARQTTHWSTYTNRGSPVTTWLRHPFAPIRSKQGIWATCHEATPMAGTLESTPLGRCGRRPPYEGTKLPTTPGITAHRRSSRTSDAGKAELKNGTAPPWRTWLQSPRGVFLPP